MTALSDPSTMGIDPIRWPDVVRIPRSFKASAAESVTRGLFRRAVARLAIRVVMPDGTTLGGCADDPAAPTMHVHNPRALMRRIGTGGLIGFGESYLAREWDSEDLAGLIAAFAGGIDHLVPTSLKRMRSAYLTRKPLSDKPSTANSRSNVERHYDLSNDMFATFLDPSMTYSAALIEGPVDADSLELAQHRKIDRMLDQAGVGEGSRVLEIGTGWGELALRAAARGAHVDSVTLSSEQLAWAQGKIDNAGFAARVDLALRDYRDTLGQYDAVLSVEMIEAVGLEYLDTYFAKIAQVLAPGGTAVIQAITMPHHRVLETRNTYTWIHKYIFPGGALASVEMLRDTAARQGLSLGDDLPMGQSYAETLRIWAETFDAAHERLEQLGFDETFRRMWRFYLRYSEGGFRADYLDVHQLTFTKGAAA
ncbi:cyclopropane-fatty-acyl-phospholipid synthase family protein [Allobranchiibius sp. GilTou38]|uniref:SAM-dependent methyltransferase n=1 Tax=Allobranchiibius sp. GilTou38 TaxID=2815210 RepID=UPI001AA0E370|nr:cyclopropane-fatty-acyl-phospholipid synthase family protein [Allobranchiibius sp. GilTou38]MBO1767973.1 class I SAM-dependent methyltransferase [Allobranchiibius sp. GilTou38]